MLPQEGSFVVTPLAAITHFWGVRRIHCHWIGLVVVGYGSIVVVSVVFGPLSLNPLSIDVGSVVFESVVVGFVVTGS